AFGPQNRDKLLEAGAVGPDSVSENDAWFSHLEIPWSFALPQVLIEKFERASVRQYRGGGIVVSAIVPGKRVALTRIAVNRRVRFLCKRGLDLHLRRFRDELVLLAKVHQQGSAQAANFAEVFFRVAAMVGNS